MRAPGLGGLRIKALESINALIVVSRIVSSLTLPRVEAMLGLTRFGIRIRVRKAGGVDQLIVLIVELDIRHTGLTNATIRPRDNAGGTRELERRGRHIAHSDVEAEAQEPESPEPAPFSVDQHIHFGRKKNSSDQYV